MPEMPKQRRPAIAIRYSEAAKNEKLGLLSGIKIDPITLLVRSFVDRDAQLKIVNGYIGITREKYAPFDLLCIAATTEYRDVQEQVAIAALPLKTSENGQEGLVFCEPLLPCLGLNPNLTKGVRRELYDITRQIHTNLIFREPLETRENFEFRFLQVDGHRQLILQTLGARFSWSQRKPNLGLAGLEVYSMVTTLPPLRKGQSEKTIPL